MTSDTSLIDLQQDPEKAAEVAGLRYVNDTEAGFTRKKKGSSFVYLDLDGKILKNERHLKRIRSLVLPPAWTDVWICASDSGHLQATGFDQKGRKQYRYHSNWEQIRNETKFNKMQIFADKLPLIRKRIEKDLKLSGMPREKVLAAIVQIMDQTMIRIGNDEYAQSNQSYGLTTLHNKHVSVRGAKARFRFKGKSGKWHDVQIEDQRISKIIRKCQDLPGQELFGYLNDDGAYVDVGSNDVNDYLKEISGENITAKDFRTWGGTVQAAQILQASGPHENKTQLKKNLTQAVKSTSEHLRNTPTVCRKYYIHPCVFETYENGKIFKVFSSCQKMKKRKSLGLYQEEIFAVRLLREALKKSA